MIIVNSRFLTQKITGVQRFAIEICKELKNSNLEFEFVTPKNIIHNNLADFLEVKKIGKLQGHLWEQITLQLYVLRKKALLISFCNTAPVFIRNQIVTIHDLSFRKYPQWNSKAFSLVYNNLIPFLAKKAMHILTVSNTSKQELVNELNISEEKISVVYNAVSSIFKDQLDINNNREKENYILTVSSFHPRKNLKRLIDAFLKISNSNIKLYIVGNFDKNFTDEGFDKNVLSSRIKILTNITDKELKTYYNSAKLFVYPSIYEGFGIPIIEAMSCGIPVCVSDISVFREVCGNNATFFNPFDIEDIKDKIILSLKRTKSDLKSTEKYSWNTSARKINEIILKLN
ncbi:glycosyltransferase family 1 protein [Polaribacter sp. Z022]|uniref:glycosyltransferase family 4 protein n=1 Tax=Polaribacter sp. Z022 TaxID=2927125 RepID=UPI00202146B6|nr:glycosyltransferase family 1 protein [Polaribacter sp. Z022]MCL7752804.1 glycosyltransferase family 4 protein [Polaribacter sp. Z022]